MAYTVKYSLYNPKYEMVVQSFEWFCTPCNTTELRSLLTDSFHGSQENEDNWRFQSRKVGSP